MFAHVPVLVAELIEALHPESGKRYLDGTLGGGGHTEEILIKSSPNGQVLGLDRDDEAIASAIAPIWQQRADRYSELRSTLPADNTPGVRRVEMSYIGG